MIMSNIDNITAQNKQTELENKLAVEENKRFALEMFKIQQQAQRDNQELASRSNIEKAKHDAIMNMANNIK